MKVNNDTTIASILAILILASMVTPNMFVMSRSAAWFNGPWSYDPDYPYYSTHDWVAEHALDWLPEDEKVYLNLFLNRYLYGTEVPDRVVFTGGPEDNYPHSVFFYPDGTLYSPDYNAAIGASIRYNMTKAMLVDGNLSGAAESAGIMTHFLADVSVWCHALGKETKDWWGMELSSVHWDYEKYVEDGTKTYDSPTWDPYLIFDGKLEYMNAYDAALSIAYNATFGEDGRFDVVWMNTTANDWTNADYRSRTGRLLNLAVNRIADVLHSIAIDTGYGTGSAQVVDIKVNEVESDPVGADEGNEWLELYNPTRSYADVSYWFISNSADKILGIGKGTMVHPKDYLLIEVPPGWLDNDWERIRLFDQGGRLVDHSPVLTDNENDTRSWSRVPNGWDTDSSGDWTFVGSTKGYANPGSVEVQNHPPIPVFTVAPDEGDTSTDFLFDASSSFDVDGDHLSYEWDWGDQTPDGAGMVATHRYALPGEYIVTMTVMDIYGGMNATNRLVKVSLSPVDAPDIDLDVDPPPIAVLDLTRSSIEIDDPVLFLASRSFDPEGGPIEYMYDFGDGSSTEWVYEDYAIHAYDEPGDYNVTLMVIDEALQTNRTIPVMVHVRPRATVNHPPTLSIRRTQDSLTVNQTLIIIVYVNDPDNEPVEVMLVTAPEGMVVVDNRYIRWRPNAKQAGLHRIEVEAVDSRTSVRTTFSIWVDPIQSKAPSETSRRTETDTFGLQPVEDMDVVFMVFLFSGVGLAITITLFMFVRRARQRGQGRKGRRGGKGRKRHKGPLMPER